MKHLIFIFGLMIFSSIQYIKTDLTIFQFLKEGKIGMIMKIVII